MPWFALDDKFHSSAAAAIAGVTGAGAYALAGSWCADHRTDGKIPREVAHKISPAAVWKKVVTAGLCRETEDGYELVDYLRGNPSRDQIAERVAAKSEAKQKAGRAGGIQSGLVRRREAVAKQNGSNHEAENEARAKQNGSETKPPSPSPSASSEAEHARVETEAQPDLLRVAQDLADEGSDFGKSCVERAASGKPLSPNMRAKLVTIRDERKGATLPPRALTTPPYQAPDPLPPKASREESAATARRHLEALQNHGGPTA